MVLVGALVSEVALVRCAVLVRRSLLWKGWESTRVIEVGLTCSTMVRRWNSLEKVLRRRHHSRKWVAILMLAMMM